PLASSLRASPTPPPPAPVSASGATTPRTLGFFAGWRRSLASAGSNTPQSFASTPSSSSSSSSSFTSASSRLSMDSSLFSAPSLLFEEPAIVTFGGEAPATINLAFASDDEDGGAEGGSATSQFILSRIEHDASRRRAASDASSASGVGYATSFGALADQLRSGFASVRSAGSGSQKSTVDASSSLLTPGRLRSDGVDWEFWGKVINDYEATARRHPRQLTRQLQQGIPSSIRGMVWQLMSNGKSPELEVTYRTLLTRTSTHEQQIQRDLARTFPRHAHFAEPGGPGQESLFNVIKAYSLFDPEVGYCQGLAFIAGPLLLNMPDEEAFCVLVRLMKGYNFRELFTTSMAGLQLRLYQFDKLLEEMLPAVAKHLEEQEIKSTMYASQWFMTLFAYRFPLEIVFRIMDIVFAEGIEAIFRFSFALLKRNQDVILSLEFEPLLEFLKVGLFDAYENSVDTLILQASGIYLSKTRLDKLALEHTEEQRKLGADQLTSNVLRSENRRLQDSLRRLEVSFDVLSTEHGELVARHRDARTATDLAATRAEELELKVDSLQSVLAAERARAEAAAKDETDLLARTNFELTRANADLVDRAEQLNARLAAARARADALERERGRLMRLRHKLGGLL
ncbi:GTPase-activating protein, partial [Cladochytrium tenue]